MLPKKLNPYVPNMYLNGGILTRVREQKYGISITSNFSDVRDIERQTHSSYCKGTLIISKFRKCSRDVEIELFKNCCSNLYCSSLRSTYTKKSFNRICATHNNIFRAFLQTNQRESISMASMNLQC